LLAFSGSQGFIVKKLTKTQIDSAGKKIDDSIRDHLSSTTMDKIVYQFKPFPEGDFNKSVDGVTLSAAEIKANSGGVTISTAKLPAFKFGLIYTSSVFASNGNYPSSYAEIVTRSLAPQYGHTPASLKALIEDGIGGVSRSNLSTLANVNEITDRCGELGLQLSVGFSTTDALVARYSILRQFSPQIFKNAQLAAVSCFQSDEKKQLEKLGYTFPDPTPEGTNRDDAVTARMDPIVKALRGGQDAALRKLSAKNVDEVRISVIGQLKELPAFSSTDPSWISTGEDAITKLIALGKLSKFGCYTASSTSSLQQIGAVTSIAGNPMGSIFYFAEDGSFDGVFIGSIDDIKRLGAFGSNYPGKCPLI